jgi:cell division protein FtsN|tara:strand:+ start:1018 stop:1560 length:543 start_codon:yes stop_codon:yes gene_type:complete
VGLGFVASLAYQGIESGESDRLGAGIMTLFTPTNKRPTNPDDSANEAEAASPERATFDFYTVLPEIEQLLPTQQGVETQATPSAKGTPEKPSAQDKEPSSQSHYMLQAGSFREAGAADHLRAQLTLAGYRPIKQQVTIQGQGQFYRVRIGPFIDMAQMEAANRRLTAMGIKTLRLKVSRR